jgi:hypothetical protein
VRLDVSKRAIAVFERKERAWEVDLYKLEQIFEAAGVEFTGGEPGVKLKAKLASASGGRRKKMPGDDSGASPTDHILHSADHSRKRAEELRTLAEVVDDPVAKRLIEAAGVNVSESDVGLRDVPAAKPNASNDE